MVIFPIFVTAICMCHLWSHDGYVSAVKHTLKERHSFDYYDALSQKGTESIQKSKAYWRLITYLF